MSTAGPAERQQTKTASTLTLCLLVLALAPRRAVPAAEESVTAAPHYTILALDNQKRFAVDDRIAAYLQAAGIELVVKPFTEPLSQAMLRQFPAVLMTQFGGLQAPWFALPDQVQGYFVMERNIAELQAYVEAGGGLVFLPNLGEAGGAAATQSFASLLAPWGIEIIAANARDEAHAWETYAWTTNVAPSPVTEGVGRLFYPTQMGRWDDLYPTPPIKLLSDAWRPIVRGMPGSMTMLCLRYKDWFPLAEVQDPPILAAIAEPGQGRAAVCAISPMYLLSHAYRPADQTWVGEFNTGAIAGTVVETGNGEQPSHGRELMRNMLRWTAAAGHQAGFGGYTPTAYEALPKPAPPAVPQWLTGWHAETPLHKILIGARSAYSDGAGTIADYAAAARTAGYAILVMTETFEQFDGDNWSRLRADCAAASSEELVVIAGLDLADSNGARYLLFGQAAFPQAFMLTPDGKALAQTQYMMLGLTPSTSVLARPGSSPLPHEIYKFFSAIAVYTYRDGKLVDNGVPAYEWQTYNRSDPMPLVVHEVYAPDQIVTAAAGHQLLVPADTPAHAAWYLRHGHQHYWEVPCRFLVTNGPVIRELTATTFSVQNKVPNLVDPVFRVDSDVPITDIRYYADYQLLRRWTPKTTAFSGQVALTHAQRTWGFLVVSDAEGHSCISPPLKGGQGYGYDWRCSDHQNWFGGAVNYTGARLPGQVDISLPVFGTDEGHGFWPHGGGPRRGENLAPLIAFPFNSPAVTITDAEIDQRYSRALWEEVAFDAKPSRALVRSRVYQARVRYHDFHYESFYDFTKRWTRPMMLIDVRITLRRPAIPTGDIFPAIAQVGNRPVCLLPDADRKVAETALSQGTQDLPLGASANRLLPLSPGLRVDARGAVGFAAAGWSNGALPAGTTWTARYVTLDEQQDPSQMSRLMGLTAATPYAIELTGGRLSELAYVAWMEADDFAVTGSVRPYADMPYAVPLSIAGVNWNWPAAVWQPGTEHPLVAFGVFEQRGWARLDVTHGGEFYAGNVVLADDPRLRISLLEWTAEGIVVEVNNPTDEPMTTALRTPAAITGYFQLRETVDLPPGTDRRLHYPAAAE